MLKMLDLLANRRTASERNDRQPYGFSLIELLVVVAILAVLAAIAIPLFLNQKAKVKTTALRSDIRNIINDAEVAKPPTGGFTTGVTNPYEETFPNRIILHYNCSFGSGSTIVNNPGSYIVRGFVNSNGGTESGTSTYIYDSSTGAWEETLNGFSARWSTLNTTVLCGNGINGGPPWPTSWGY